MGTFNACTVREEARLVELAHCAEERGVEILGVQEHRRVHTDDQIVYHKVERCTFITSSAWRNEAQAATGGVGLLLGSRARKALRRVYQHAERILIAEFSSNPLTTVIVGPEARTRGHTLPIPRLYQPQWCIPHRPSHGARTTGSEHLVPEKTRQEMDLPGLSHTYGTPTGLYTCEEKMEELHP